MNKFRAASNGLAMALARIILNDDLVPICEQLLDEHIANVTSSTRDEHAPVASG